MTEPEATYQREAEADARRAQPLVARARVRAVLSDQEWPSNHAHYMPEPCAEILTGWLYPMAEDTLALTDALAVAERERDEAREALRQIRDLPTQHDLLFNAEAKALHYIAARALARGQT